MINLNGMDLADYIDAQAKANKARRITGRQYDTLAQMIAEKKTDAQITTRLKRPDLDMAWFREVDVLLAESIRAFMAKVPEFKGDSL
jgi:hypothetical protein